MPETNIFYDKQYKATMTGITKLKEGKYRSRYRLSQGYQVLATGHLTVKPKKIKDPKQCAKDVDKKHTTNMLQEPGIVKKKAYGISKQVIRNRMRAMVNMLHTKSTRIQKAKLYFFTITFDQGTADDVCYQALNTWLTILRQRKLILSYLWVAERQKNGTVHFHLAIPHYMNAKKVNRIMKRILIDLKNKGLLPTWERGKLFRYNGVDIAKNRKTKRPVNFAAGGKGKALTSYLTKYITKNNTTMDHLAWHCSRDWSALIIGMTFTREELSRFVTGKMLDPEPLLTEYCDFYRWKDFQVPENFAKHLGNMNHQLLSFVVGSKGNFIYSLN